MTTFESNEKSTNPKSVLTKKLEEKEHERLRKMEINKRASAAVIADLAQSGYQIDWISELYNNRINYKGAIPILLYWLTRIDNLAVKEEIVRALSVPWAKPTAAPELITAFLQDSADSIFSYKWAIGNALSVVADDSVFDDIVRLVRDKEHGRAREMVAVALGNMKNPQAVDVLIDLLQDEEVAGHALIALRKLRPLKARPYIEPFLNHPTTWVRKEAQKAIEKIDKANQ